MSVTKLATIYLVCESKLRCYKVPYGIPNACIVWISLKTLCSSVLALSADAKLLDFFPKRQQHDFTYKWNTAYTYAIYGITISACARGVVVPVVVLCRLAIIIAMRRGFCVIVLHFNIVEWTLNIAGK